MQLGLQPRVSGGLSVAAIRFGGMASGLPPNLVDQIMEAERIPVKNIQENKGKQETKLKLVQDLETKLGDVTKSLGELVGTRGFSNNKLLSGDPNVIGGTVDPDASVPGSWNVEVMQLAHKPSAFSVGFPDKDVTQLGVGYLKFKTPEGTREVYINGNENTLDGVAKKINASNIGVRASVINDRSDKENPFRLIIAGLATGDDKQVEFPTVYLLDGDQDMYFEKTRPAQNGKVKIDGFEVEISDNTISDLVPGVTLELKQAAPGREITVSVKEDMEVISGKIKTFVDAYNGILSFIQTQNQMNEKTDTSKTLGGDSLLRSVENRLRQIIQGQQLGLPTTITRVGELGIEFNRNGTLNFNQEKFNTMLAKKPQDIANFLRGDGFSVGFVPTVKRAIASMVDSAYGPVSNRKRGIQQKITNMDKQIDNKEKQLARREETLRRQFSNLEQKMSQIKSQGASVGMIGSVGSPAGAPQG